jgi:Na+/H+-translocating membrane pyrophosphatase
MSIAVNANLQTTKECAFSLERGFIIAYRAGSVLGFILVGLCLLVHVLLIMVYKGNIQEVIHRTLFDRKC